MGNTQAIYVPLPSNNSGGAYLSIGIGPHNFGKTIIYGRTTGSYAFGCVELPTMNY